jgi:hypothetical protein
MVVLESAPLGFPWQTLDPFLFCVHHDDAYPAGEENMGPPRSTLAGRRIGMDFEGRDGWRMYHGEDVPGFPAHPHRGFETVTIVRRGFIDHSDSLGAAARFGAGDVQWLTAGAGIVHSEMFPLLDRAKPNPLELFQIWLNLPKKSKMAEPHFAMLWSEDIPRIAFTDDRGRTTEVVVVAGALGDRRSAAPPPRSWASDPENEVAIWTIRMQAGARWTLPRVAGGALRALYFFRGPSVNIGGGTFDAPRVAVVDPAADVTLEAGDGEVELLVLQGRPIGEPVVQHGPFVMNDRAGIQQAMLDYQRTRFGGWPWPSEAPVHPREEGRFAKHADGRVERTAR